MRAISQQIILERKHSRVCPPPSQLTYSKKYHTSTTTRTLTYPTCVDAQDVDGRLTANTGRNTSFQTQHLLCGTLHQASTNASTMARLGATHDDKRPGRVRGTKRNHLNSRANSMANVRYKRAAAVARWMVMRN